MKITRKKIGEVCLVGDGAHAKIKRQATGILYLTCKNFKEGNLDLSNCDHISHEDYEKYFRSDSKALTKPDTDDILFSIIGTLGESYVYRDSDKFGISSSVSILRPDRNIIKPKYLFYWIKSYAFQKALYGIKGGVAQSYVSLDMIKALPLHYPPLPIQQKITYILSKYDDLIENNRRRIELLERSARLLYKEWFVRLRFPGHEHTPIIDGIPEGWERVQLKNVALVNSESLSKKFQGLIQYIDISSVTPRKINKTDCYNFHEAPSRARRIVHHGDIIWSCVRPNRESHAIIWNPPNNLIASTGFAVITPCKIPTSFLYQVVTTPDFVGYLSQNARGSAYPAVTATDFENARFIIPDSSLIQIFDDIVRPIIEQINNLDRYNQKLKQARDILLPKLMNGEIEV